MGGGGGPPPVLDPGTLTIGSHTFPCACSWGRACTLTLELMRDCLDASGAEVVHVAVRRERLFDREGRQPARFSRSARTRSFPIRPAASRPRTPCAPPGSAASCSTAWGTPGADRVKLEVLADTARPCSQTRWLLWRPLRVLVEEGLPGPCYTGRRPDDGPAAQGGRGPPAVMPAGSPIGSGQGCSTPTTSGSSSRT